MNKFELVSDYTPTGDQPKAIAQLVEQLNAGKKDLVLLGATGTGKTFTISNVIAQDNKPTLVLAHNKTLAGQLYSEFKQLFPNNRVEYFVSNFDYYQPEAYMPKTDTYIEKTAMINQELDMLRLSSINSVLTRRDTIVVASVACIYASSDPDNYKDMFFTLRVNETIDRDALLKKLVDRQYTRNDMELKKGTFRVKGDVIDIHLGHTDAFILRVEMFDNYIERIVEVDRLTFKVLDAYQIYHIFPANEYARMQPQILHAADTIEAELEAHLKVLESQNKLLEKQRLEQRTRYDIEALREFGFCSGIENYSRHIDQRQPGQRPFTLFDFFGDDFLFVIDESHVSIPQVKGMYRGDRSRKEVLVEYGFRLPSALDNRPLNFEEFLKMPKQTIYVSATPGEFELERANHEIVEQIIRPTYLLDPEIVVRPSKGQIDDLLDEIHQRSEKQQRVLITTLTVKMAEELTNYLLMSHVKAIYLHHETKTLERIEIIHDLRKGKYDVLVGINLLREGIDIPEVSLVAILDADKEGFLRSYRSLVQTIGRAARNEDGQVIMYADRMTDSLNKAIEETNRRRKIQEAYNVTHNIIPKTVVKEIRDVIAGKETQAMAMAMLKKKTRKDTRALDAMLSDLEKEMHEAARVLDFERAATLRDIILELKSQ